MARTQVTSEEIRDESIKGVDVDESTLNAKLIPYSSSEVIADNIHDAIDESAKSGSHSGWSCIPSGEVGIVKINKQSLSYHGNIIVRGNMKVRGNLILGGF